MTIAGSLHFPAVLGGIPNYLRPASSSPVTADICAEVSRPVGGYVDGVKQLKLPAKSRPKYARQSSIAAPPGTLQTNPVTAGRRRSLTPETASFEQTRWAPGAGLTPEQVNRARLIADVSLTRQDDRRITETCWPCIKIANRSPDGQLSFTCHARLPT